MKNNLCKIRNNRGIPQKKVAADLHISQGTVSLYESGDRSLNDELVLRFADYYDVSTDEILGKIQDNTTEELLSLEIARLYLRLNNKGREELLRVANAIEGNPSMKGGHHHE